MGRIKTASVSLENAILSSFMFGGVESLEFVARLSEDDFSTRVNQSVFASIRALAEADKPIDDIMIAAQLKKQGIQNPEDALIDIMAATPISLGDDYIVALQQYTKKRHLLDIKNNIERQLDSETAPEDIFLSITHAIESSTQSTAVDSHREIPDIIEDILEDMEAARTNSKMPFLETGYNNFDSSIGGFIENGLTVIAGRPSMGKSSFTSGPIIKNIEEGRSVVLYSMEVVDKNALKRLISYRAQEPLSNINKGTVSNYKAFSEALEFFKKHKDRIAIVDRSGMTKMQIEVDIKQKLRTMDNLSLVIVDHLLQVALAGRRNTAEELGEVTKMLKRIAQNNKISTVLLSQLNREVEKRENKRPTMSDLQGSGSIEQDADLIVFLYRPEYYKEKEWDVEKNGKYERPDIENAEAIVGKNRDGPTCVVGMKFKATTASFLNDTEPEYVVEYVDTGDFKNQNDTIQETNEYIDIPMI